MLHRKPSLYVVLRSDAKITVFVFFTDLRRLKPKPWRRNKPANVDVKHGFYLVAATVMQEV